MKTMTKDVKSKSEVVGQAEYPQYDNVEEAVQNEGESTCLGYINSQVRTNEMNRVRGEATGRPSKEALRAEAMSRISTEEFTEVVGDKVAMESLIRRKMDELVREKGLDEENDENDE